MAGRPWRRRGDGPLGVSSLGGNLDRARLLVHDPGFGERQRLWQSVPSRLDGTGSAAATAAEELLSLAEGALAPLRERHARELAALEEQAEAVGARGIPGRKQTEDRHRREERRWRTDDLRMGLAALSGAYRDRMVAAVGADGAPRSAGDGATRRRAARQVEAVATASAALGRNAQEGLLLEALMVELSGMLD